MRVCHAEGGMSLHGTSIGVRHSDQIPGVTRFWQIKVIKSPPYLRGGIPEPC